MKKIALFLVCFISTVQLSFSQSYAPFYTSSKNVYLGDSIGVEHMVEEVLITKIDSFVIEGKDTILYPFKQMGHHECDTMSPLSGFRASWMGVKIKKGADTTVIDNEYGESIYLKHAAQSGDKWAMHTDSSGNYIEATVLLIDTMYIQDKGLDSIKIISLQKKDSSGNNLTSDLNNDSLILSKQYGIIQTYQWDYFPYTFRWNNEDTQQRTRKFIDYEYMSYKEVYDLDTGDVFHYADNYQYGWKYINVKIIDKWLSLTSDKVYYEREIAEEEYIYYYSTSTDTTLYRFYKDTVDYKYTDEKLHDTLVPTKLSYWTTLSIQLGKYKGRKMERVGHGQWIQIDDCYGGRYYSGGIFRENIYAPGLGRVRHQWTESSTRTLEMIYFKKGTETWGTPRLVTGINETITAKNEFSIYPNPSNGLLRLQTDANNFEVAIRDMQGKMVFQNNNEKELNLSHLSKGVYFVEVRTSTGMGIQKLILKD